MIWIRDTWSITSFLVFPAVFQLLMAVLCDNKLTIHDANEFLAFSSNANSGTNFNGTTVYLGSDIDFTDDLSQQFKAINYFRGTFDGQGHVIRNLAINASSSYQYVGLFGYSFGATIRNAVIDETCSVVSSYTSNKYVASTGSIIGYCYAYYGSCILENNVNMAGVTFNGNTSKVINIGGIAGILISANNNQGAIKNCANYNSVSDAGTSAESHLGGIIGSPQGNSSSTSIVYIQNCANYGTVLYNGISSSIVIGGISGLSYFSTIDNCVSSGPIVVDSSGSGTKIVGSIVGYARSAIITHCYWNMSIEYDACGYKASSHVTDSYSFDPSSFELAEPVSIGNYAGASLIGALNGAADYYTLRDYSNWALNKDSRNVSFTVNGRARPSFTTSAQVILLPDLASEGNMTFSGWYTDSACTVPLTDFTIDSDEKKDLYGLWGTFNYTINFDTRGGSFISSITSSYGSIVELPTSTTKSGYKFLNWETEYDDPVPNTFTIPSRNITLYAVWLCEHITTARDLIAFSGAVNSGTNYEGMTVYLDSDIDFTDGLSHRFEVIGRDGNNYFRGAFDGQGHVIRNLAINASSSYQTVGLFGYSTGTTIRNVVIDETCSIVNDYVMNGFMCTGGITGYCYAHDGSCILENNVNMAGVKFNGNTNNSFTGGIAGGLVSSKHEATIKNCANYGTISNIGTSKNNAYLGGIVGSSLISSTSTSFSAYVQNCANYGAVLYNGSSNNIAIGGISGYSDYSTIENCVSYGPIVVSSSISGIKFAGSIVGYASSSTTTTHCYWTLDVGCNNIASSDSSVTITETTYTEHLNTTTLDELNAYATSTTGFSQWVMLHLNGGSVSNLAQSDLVVAQEHFPSPVKEGNTFLRWCKDLECGEVYDNNLTDITALYAVWKTVRVTFTFWNGTTTGPVGVEYGAAYGALPEAGTVVEGHTLRWFISNGDDEGNKRVVTPDTIVTTSSDHTLHGRWVANNYTVTLDLGNGTVIARTLQYNESIELPLGIAREGCTHTGWNNSNTITNMPAKNITISALWNCTHNSHSSSSDEPISRGGDKSKSSSNTGAIVGGVVGGLVAIILIVLAVLVLLVFKDREEEDSTWSRAARRMKMRRNKARGRSSSARNTKQQTRRGNRREGFETGVEMATDTARTYEKLYPTWYNVSTMQDALTSAGLSQSQAKSVVDACNLTGRNAEREGKLCEGLTSGDAAAIAMYTYSFDEGDYESNPYRLINEALMGGEEEGGKLDEVKGLLYLVMCSLRRLPRCTGKTLYRGMKEGVDRTMYKKGNSVVWHGLSSTSPDIGATKAFLASNTVSGKAEGTLFIIDNGWGYDIQPYSLFPEEAEVLLEPEREFKVQDVIEAELIIIKLEMVDTPVILPEIFGENV